MASPAAEVRHLPIQTSQVQQVFDRAQALAQGQSKQALDAQAELDGSIRESRLAATLADGWGVPLRVRIQPDRQRTSRLECRVVVRPVCRLVSAPRAFAFTHAQRLPAGTGDLRNKADLHP